MIKKSSKNPYGKVYEYYICGTYKNNSNKLCTSHKIRLQDLEQVVLQAIRFHIHTYIKMETLLEKMQKTNFEVKEKKDQNRISIQNKKNEINKILNLKLALYEDWKNEDITKEEYKEYKIRYQKDIERLKQHIQYLEQEHKKQQTKREIHNEWMEQFKKDKNITTLSREIITEFIDTIYIFEGGKINIVFKFDNTYER